MHQCYYCEQIFDTKEALYEHVEIHSDTERNKEIMDRNIQIATAIEEQSVVIEDVNRTTISIKDISMQVDEFASKQYDDSRDLVQDVEGQQQLLDKFVV